MTKNTSRSIPLLYRCIRTYQGGDNPTFHYAWVVLACSLFSTFAMSIDMTVVGTLYPLLTKYFNEDELTVTSLTSASLGVAALLSFAVGYLNDKWGPTRLIRFGSFVSGVFICVFASGMCDTVRLIQPTLVRSAIFLVIFRDPSLQCGGVGLLWTADLYLLDGEVV